MAQPVDKSGGQGYDESGGDDVVYYSADEAATVVQTAFRVFQARRIYSAMLYERLLNEELAGEAGNESVFPVAATSQALASSSTAAAPAPSGARHAAQSPPPSQPASAGKRPVRRRAPSPGSEAARAVASAAAAAASLHTSSAGKKQHSRRRSSFHAVTVNDARKMSVSHLRMVVSDLERRTEG